MKKSQRRYCESVAQSASGHSSERDTNINSAHAKTSHFPQFCSFRYRQYFLSLQQGKEYTNGHIHSQKNNLTGGKKKKKKMEETLKRPPKAFSLSTKFTLLHYNSKK